MTEPAWLPVVIDTDPGIDDVLALMLAARWARCDLRIVSAVYGNTTLDLAARNARIALARGGAPDVMVLPGADRPLARPLVTAKETHGTEGLGDHTAEPPRPVFASPSALRDALRAAREPVVLVTLGPLTNLAHALRLDPDLVHSRVQRHVMMGGSIAARGTATPASEFNVWCDPEAAAEVFAAGLGTWMVGMDVTRRLVIPAATVAKLAGQADPDARWLGGLLGFYVRFHQQHEGLAGAVINDPLAVALALEPGWGAASPMPVAVDRSHDEQRGRTVIGDTERGDPVISVYRDVDLAAVHALLLEQLFGRWLTRDDFAA
jgi:inosine-uridine nucleoside N-ribohydrolase